MSIMVRNTGGTAVCGQVLRVIGIHFSQWVDTHECVWESKPETNTSV